VTPAPRQLADEITLSELQEDPCLTCRGLRDAAPVQCVPAAGGLVTRIIGHTLLRNCATRTNGNARVPSRRQARGT